MSEGAGVDWPTCSEDSCLGVRLGMGDRCLAHAKDQDLDAEMKRFGEDGTIDARGVTISVELLDRMLAAAPRDEEKPDRPRFHAVRFDRAKFQDQANLAGAVFGNRARFDAAIFGNEARFDDATFGDDALFGPLVSRGGLSLRWATFGRNPGITISAAALACQRMRLPEGARLNIRWAVIRLDGATFSRPSMLAGSKSFGPRLDEAEAALRLELPTGRSGRPINPS
jgi:hypothetical protein